MRLAESTLGSVEAEDEDEDEDDVDSEGSRKSEPSRPGLRKESPLPPSINNDSSPKIEGFVGTAEELGAETGADDEEDDDEDEEEEGGMYPADSSLWGTWGGG